jgi:pimeloyl-ACP methyl ester carboxylesterase
MDQPGNTGPPTGTVKTGLIEVNDTSLYYEVRGSGPAVLFIPGALGDAGYFTQVAEELADEFSPVTYDRRGNSRSPQPPGWKMTSMDEQADDAAGLLEALALVPAVVYGNSIGAIIGLNLLLRYPHLLRGAMLHEPPLLSVLAHPETVIAMIQATIARGREEGGPRGAVEGFLRAVGANIDNLESAVRERMFLNSETFLGMEFLRFGGLPDDATLAAVTVPVQVLTGTHGQPFRAEVAQWLAARLHVTPAVMPGGHTPQIEDPHLVAETIRPFLRRVCATTIPLEGTSVTSRSTRTSRS